MSDSPQGPDWWQASDGAWYPPELHPSLEGDVVRGRRPAGGAAGVGRACGEGPPDPRSRAAKRPTWSNESDQRPDAGPVYPDLFQQAVSGSSLANVVTVEDYADGEARPSLDVPASTSPGSEQFLEDGELVSVSARMPAEVGAFSGASAKRRWRILR